MSASTMSLEDDYIAVHEKSDSQDSYPHAEDDATIPRRVTLASVDEHNEFVSTLKSRLRASQVPEQLHGSGWDYGIESGVLNRLRREWLENYSWETELAKLNNEHEHWTVEVDGLFVHYIRHDPWANVGSDKGSIAVDSGLAGKTEDMVNDKSQIIMPLLLVHGWPGSIYEFNKALQLLKPLNRFQIIVPSLPGFGWSQAPRTKGFGIKSIAKLFHNLMQHLGYKHYLVQGGDWGAMIARYMATLYPESALAIHINMLPCIPPSPVAHPLKSIRASLGFLAPGLIYRSNQRAIDSIKGLKRYAEIESGYFILQSTKPQTLGNALEDSPLGLLSWLGEKYLGWADLDPLSDPKHWPFTITELLNQVMIYHSTKSITSSVRIYYESRKTKDVARLLKTKVPNSVYVGVGVWNKELFMVPRDWAEGWMNVRSWNEYPKGGHFAAFERPQEFVDEIVGFFTRDEVLDAFTAKRFKY